MAALPAPGEPGAVLEWTQFPVGHVVPAPRWGHSFVAVTADHIVLFGGLASNGDVFSDIFLYTISSGKWVRPRLSGVVPSGRWGHSATVVARYRVLIGARARARVCGREGVCAVCVGCVPRFRRAARRAAPPRACACVPMHGKVIK